MKFGTETKENLILCKNCGYIVSKDGELRVNYCSRCGSPQSLYAISETEGRYLEIQSAYLNKILHLSKELKTDSLEKILKELS